MLTLTVKGAADLRDLARDLRRSKGTLRSELTKSFKRAGADTLKRVKQNMTSMEIKGFRTGAKRIFVAPRSGTGIRQRIARVTELDVRTGSTDPQVQFQVHTDRLGDAKNLPWHLDTGKKFRHPIMGYRGRWAASMGKPWFYDEIRSDLDVFIAECDEAIDKTIQAIERG